MNRILETVLTVLAYLEVWLCDFEFHAPAGERPTPICMVAHELRSGRVIRLWEDELRQLRAPPFSIGADALFVAYYASAELSCFLALGWPMPANVLDLYVEFRLLTNGRRTPCGNDLLGAQKYFGLGGIDAADKDSMRQVAIRGGPFTTLERVDLVDYCESDVVALARLLERMAPGLDLPRALLRGRFMAAAARMEHAGVPMDTEALAMLVDNWTAIQDELIAAVDAAFGVYEGRTFKADRFAHMLATRGISWPRLPSGALALDDDTFKDMARSHPQLEPLRQLRYSMAQMRLADLAVGRDGRNRTLLSAFRARTGRNQPSNTRFAFGPSVWLRSLIKPAPGMALAYIDWEQQEFGIAAALSGDTAMMAAYASGDPYLAFAQQAGAVPGGATKKTHCAVREQFKQCALATQYGMGSDSLGIRIGQPIARARELLALHRATYPTYWQWSDAALNFALLHEYLFTVFGWQVHVVDAVNPRSLRNFPVQANGAEALRLACCFATEAGITVCAPVHDALLVEAPADTIDEVVAETQDLMARASEVVLCGFRLRSDAKVVRFPDRYTDPRGEVMWREVWRTIAKLRGGSK